MFRIGLWHLGGIHFLSQVIGNRVSWVTDGNDFILFNSKWQYASGACGGIAHSRVFGTLELGNFVAVFRVRCFFWGGGVVVFSFLIFKI